MAAWTDQAMQALSQYGKTRDLWRSFIVLRARMSQVRMETPIFFKYDKMEALGTIGTLVTLERLETLEKLETWKHLKYKKYKKYH